MLTAAIILASACDEQTMDPALDAAPVQDAAAPDSAGDQAATDQAPQPDQALVDSGKTPDKAPAVDAKAPAPDMKRTQLVAVTFNTGTSESMGHDKPPADGYTSKHAKTSDTYYGDGLAWTKAVTATTKWLTQVKPDVIAFQEIFYSEECATIPAASRKDFICETWKKGDPTVANLILGKGYQVACHPGKPDKCAAVKKSLGTFAGCKTDFCLSGLVGYKVNDCGKGSRVGRGVINLVGGGTITLVSVHGSSGIDKDSKKCREKQFDQVWKNLGDGKPAASGKKNLILGDFNTDPGRMKLIDNSADRITKYVGPGKKFHFISDVGFLAKPTYAGLINIDHVISDYFKGKCWAAGVTAGKAKVVNAVYFDHVPIVCTVNWP